MLDLNQIPISVKKAISYLKRNASKVEITDISKLAVSAIKKRGLSLK